jgi:hypothetical protein
LTLVNGKTAIVMALCPGDRVSDVSTWHADADGNSTTATWQIIAKPAQTGTLFVVGQPHAGFTTKIPLVPSRLNAGERAAVVVTSPPSHPDAYTAFTEDDFKLAKAGSVLVGGKYFSFAQYKTDFAMCKQIKNLAG